MGRKFRMSLQTLQVLRVLLINPQDGHYGLEISRTCGLPTGSIYPILTRLEGAGWVTSAWEDIDEAVEGRRRRRYYKLTEDGAANAQCAVEEAQQLLSATATPSRAPLRHGSPQPGGAL